ncbi:DUF6902 family protein [Pseudaestuariivita atlantica]|uniref:Uncharacterized protein n=1 Tax=Pseudaestuariivita atlantica TaxID=1317121 RepID=A0A0L1JVS4_9RHOB|nr:hypothetical protein [Pseudaestuariivita atlantica]KNG95473.1 hypothetical protein ATO11_02415 [Pseudaestuariivita atlantica]
MSNVVAVDFKPRATTADDRAWRLSHSFARHRRFGEDVLWLKENAEFLNVLETGPLDVSDDALEVYDDFYARAAERMAYFPQYYRFFLGMVLDLEALRGGGETGLQLAEFARDRDLVAAELSDLQRAEARRLMLRRGIDPVKDPGLTDRLIVFASRPETFALPNKKAAYELTHIVFYLSEYGRRAPDLPDAVRRSLENAGTLAALEMNADLLSEICVALRFGGWTPPAGWEDWLARFVAASRVLPQDGTPVADGYHPYLVTQWHAGLTGGAQFGGEIGEGAVDFLVPGPSVHALREVSQALMHDPARTGDWEVMQRRLDGALSHDAGLHLAHVAETSPDFAAFFDVFARALPWGAVPSGLDSGFGA